MRLKALDEIYKIYMLLHRSNLKKMLQSFIKMFCCKFLLNFLVQIAQHFAHFHKFRSF